MEFLKRISKNGENGMSRSVLSGQVKDIVVEAILNGELKAGDRVAEKTLAERLGVSQAPVRDAVRDLCMMGFLKSEPYKGATVRSFTLEELNEVYLVRAALESLGARLAAPRLTESNIKTLRKILDKMIATARKKDIKETTRLNNEFHETIIKISGNKLLHQLWKTLLFGYWTIVTARMSNYDLEYLARRHGEVFEALITRDPLKAMVAMQHHLEYLGNPIDEAAEHTD